MVKIINLNVSFLVVSPEMQSLVRTSMNPSFTARPDVDTLLRLPRIEDILSKRRKFEPIRKMVVSCTNDNEKVLFYF